ncbi:hypothetical protein G7068_16090 [Leucobacter viscericola]|uniref:Uncharacterized protein n=1 Tax=Leucobacter viscericola TaxID=2714935 RepID=A0A6G7XB45_9MICO|nr:hypothetical protein [Leucobacter viscericola]QIK61785.1 hypothetical protein G7068_00100 [Leucobacter viscericola]QIK64567.1 hypothetical protein G7068_16090 [Leucobacter viscericola]
MTTLLGKAIAAYAASDLIGRPERRVLAKELAEFDALSKRQIASIVRLDPNELVDAFEKTDSRGGRLNPETLEIIEQALTLPEGEAIALYYKAYQEGTSVDAIATLIGQSRDYVWNRIRKHKKGLET